MYKIKDINDNLCSKNFTKKLLERFVRKLHFCIILRCGIYIEYNMKYLSKIDNLLH